MSPRADLDRRRARVLVAPDSFKGSLAAPAVAAAVAAAWRAARPGDEVVELPMADGGEGTLDRIAAARPGARRHTLTVPDPVGLPVAADWLLLPDGTAVVELAQACGLPLLREPAPLTASTAGLGHLLRAAAGDPSVHRVVVALGGSATTDGGTGALGVLGARFLDRRGTATGPGGGALAALASVRLGGLTAPPAGGVRCLVDVDSPLTGPLGAARRFAPQKGAGPDDVELLERGLQRLAAVAGRSGEAPGSGAAGGTAFGLAAFWSAQLVPGAAEVAALTGLDEAVRGSDVVITGEGSYDAQSSAGKAAGHVVDRALAAGAVVVVLAGRADRDLPPPHQVLTLTALAPSVAAAVADPGPWLAEATRRAAARI